MSSTGSIAPPRVAARRWRPEPPARFVGLGVLILVLSVIPYLCGYLLAPQGKTFLGALNNVGDLSQYLAAIRQGSHGAWRYTDQFTPDHATRLLIYTPYLLMGHISFGLTPGAAFQVMRLLCGGFLLFAIASFSRLFIGPFALRACWLFVVLAGGLYWLALPLSVVAPNLVNPAQLTAPELSPLITLLISPHESLGLAAELIGFLCILRASGATEPLWANDRPRIAEPRAGSRYVYGAAASFLVLSLSYPFLLPTIGAVLFAYAAVAARSAWNGRIAAAAPKRRLRAGQVFAAELRTIVIALVPGGLVGLYYLYIFHGDPLWSHSGLAQTGRPDLSTLVFAFGALAAAAYGGARKLQALRRSGGDAVPAAWAWFPFIWGVTNLCTLMLPVWQQGRQALGLSVAFALLSFLWLAGPRAVTDGMRTLPAIPASVLAISSALLVSLYTAIAAAGVNSGYYVPAGVASAVSWIGETAGSNDVVLASAGFGNLVPVSCSCKVVVGQNFQTFNLPFRQLEVHQFYGAASPAAALRALHRIIDREHVTVVVYSPLERGIGHMELHDIPGFARAYSDDGVVIFDRERAHAHV